MSPNGIFGFTGFTGSGLNYFGRDDFGVANDLFNKTDLDLQNHERGGPSNPSNPRYLQPPEVGNRSRPYRGVEVLGGLNEIMSHLRNPLTAPMTLYREGKSYPPPSNVSFRDSYIHHRI